MKKAAVLIAAALLAAHGLPARADRFGPEDYSFRITEDGEAFIASGADGLIVPSTLDGHEVAAIGAGAFSELPREKVFLPDTVVSLGQLSFFENSIWVIRLPDSLEWIGMGAFMMSFLLEEIVIPSKVRVIQPAAFMSCKSLRRIGVAAGNPCYAEIDGVLFDKTERTLHTYPAGKEGASYSVPRGILAIGHSAFYGCDKLRAVVLPDGLERISVAAFGLCTGLASLDIPDSVAEIGENAFMLCEGLQLVVGSGSAAMRYAQENGIAYDLR